MNDRVLPNNLINFDSPESLLKFPKDFYIEAKSYLSKKDIRLIRKAYTFAHQAHVGQKRKDGSDYISHPTAVAKVLLELGMDADSICAGFMHDVLEDCDVQKEVQISQFEETPEDMEEEDSEIWQTEEAPCKEDTRHDEKRQEDQSEQCQMEEETEASEAQVGASHGEDQGCK